MSLLAERVWQTVRRHHLIPPGSRLMAAVSGGSDSVALAHLLRELEGPGEFQLAGLAHLNHRLRGAAADEDEAFCRCLAADLSVPIDVEAADVGALATEKRISLEEAGRTQRYAFFDRAARRLGVGRIALGHTRDDQAETVLLRLLRGAGPRGLAGMHPRAGSIVRPLLEISREELRSYLRDRAMLFRDDATNADVAIPRNRVRHELIPFLRERFSPGITGVLAREADIARADAAFLDRAAGEAAARILTPRTERSLELDIEALRQAPVAVARRVCLLAMRAVSPDRFFAFEHVDTLLELAADGGAARVDLPGLRVERFGAKLSLLKARRPGSGANRVAVGSKEIGSYRYALSVPGEVWLSEAACAIEAEKATQLSAGGRGALAGHGNLAVVEARGLPHTLVVRNRKPGDAFRPLGLGGRKKLQDFFVDRKVLRNVRDSVPLVVDDQDRIIWVAGHALADEFRVTDHTQAVVILRLKDWGGQV